MAGDRTNAQADFWWDPGGNLVVRFTCGEEDIHLAASKVSGKEIKESDLDEFSDFIADTLFEWMVEGIDDIPSSIYATSD